MPARGRPKPRFRAHLEPLEGRLAPATHVWNGLSSDSWSDPGNWGQGGSPYGDRDAVLVFPASNVRSLNSINDGPPETHLSGIRFERDGYTVSGGPIQLASGISSTNTGTNTVAFQSLSFDGTVSANGFSPAAGGTLDVKSTIVQNVTTQPLTKGSAGTLILSGNNTFTSGVRLEAGTLVPGNSAALGSGTLVLAGGTLESSVNHVELANRFTVTRSSTVTYVGWNLVLTGDGQIFQDQTLRVVAPSPAALVEFSGILFGPGGLTKSGPGDLWVRGGRPNTYEGVTALQGGRILVFKDNALGTGRLVLSGGELGTPEDTSVTLPNPFEVSGGIIRPGGSGDPNDPNDGITFSGPGTILQGATLVVEGYGPPVVVLRANFSGPLNGPGGLTINFVAKVVLSGTAANTYTGTTTVNGGPLVLQKPAGVNAIPGPLVIGEGAGAPLTAVVSLGADNQIADTVPVTIKTDGQFKMNNFNDKINLLTNKGKVTGGDPPTLTVDFDEVTATFEGEIEGPVTVVKDGTGTWILSGANTYEGGTIVAGGTLLVDGSIVGTVMVQAGATFGGTGTTGPVTLSPGASVSPGGAAPGIQAVQDLTFGAGSSFAVQLNGPDPGTGYDQLDVAGTVSLNDATLDASLGFSPAAGERFVIIQNDGADLVSGTFAGLPQGATLWIGGVPFRVSYDGGDGNDVELVRNVPPAVTVPGDQTAYQNVGLAVGGIHLDDPDDANLTVTLQVSHGTLTPGAVAGLTVVGDGTSSVTLSGGIADLNAALDGLLYRPDHNYSGADVLAVTASDGLETTSARVAIRVRSLTEQAADLRAQVNALLDAGVLNRGQANSLVVKLDLRDNDGDIGRVQAFLNEVGALLNAGILSRAQADLLLGAGNVLLTGLRRR
jgi:autotransporter-associated beta strand protein